jgi:hypothetical protein
MPLKVGKTQRITHIGYTISAFEEAKKVVSSEDFFERKKIKQIKQAALNGSINYVIRTQGTIAKKLFSAKTFIRSLSKRFGVSPAVFF